jgi:fucose permease
MPGPTGAGRFVLADAAPVLGRPLLFLIGLFLFLYITCEVGMWNWLPRYLIAQGIPESRALNILSLGFALGLLIGRGAILPFSTACPRSRSRLVGSAAMAVTTFLMLRINRPGARMGAGFLIGDLDGARLSHDSGDSG